jgi:hypothetical protein
VEQAMTERHSATKPHASATTREDVRHILGDVQESCVVEILALRPSVRDLEQAAVWLAGDGDWLGRDGRPLAGTAADIVAIVAEQEEEEEQGPVH